MISVVSEKNAKIRDHASFIILNFQELWTMVLLLLKKKRFLLIKFLVSLEKIVLKKIRDYANFPMILLLLVSRKNK